MGSSLHPARAAISIGIGLLLSSAVSRFVTKQGGLSAIVALSLLAVISLWIGISTDLLNPFGLVVRANYALFGLFIGLAALFTQRLVRLRREITGS